MESQKLIYSGQILVDDRSIESYSMKPTDFLVLMITKPKATPKQEAPKVDTPKPVSVPPASTPVTAPVQSSAPVVPPVTQTAPAPALNTPAFGESALVSGQELELAVTNLMEMGFPRDQVMAALVYVIFNLARCF